MLAVYINMEMYICVDAETSFLRRRVVKRVRGAVSVYEAEAGEREGVCMQEEQEGRGRSVFFHSMLEGGGDEGGFGAREAIV